jgi:DeoR family transcriptional regulator of aga operon
MLWGIKEKCQETLIGKRALDRLKVSDMLNEERQRAILDLLRRDGRVLVVDLARQFHTSAGHHPQRPGDLACERRDSPRPRWRTSSGQRRLGRSLFAGKREAASQGEAADCVGCSENDIGRASCRPRFGHYDYRRRSRPPEFQNLTVITNAANIAAELSGSVLEVILTGGSLRKNSFSLVGPLAEETLHKLHADIPVFLW